MHAVRPLRVAFAAVALAALVGAGCAKSDDASPNSGTTQPASTKPAGSNGATPSGQASSGPACSAETLTAAATSKYPGATLSEVVCDVGVGVATIKGGEGRSGDGVALFRLTNGAWVLVADGATTDAAIVPADFDATTFNAWKAKYNQITNPKVTTKPGGNPEATTATGVEDGSASNCSGEGANVVCVTTTVPPSTQPGETLPPSMFCKYNYAMPECIADQSYTP